MNLYDVVIVTNDLNLPLSQVELAVPYYVKCQNEELPLWRETILAVWEQHVYKSRNSEDLASIPVQGRRVACLTPKKPFAGWPWLSMRERDEALYRGLNTVVLSPMGLFIESSILWENGRPARPDIFSISRNGNGFEYGHNCASVQALASRGVALRPDPWQMTIEQQDELLGINGWKVVRDPTLTISGMDGHSEVSASGSLAIAAMQNLLTCLLKERYGL